MAYAARTRARDDLVMTFVGGASEFLRAMADEVEWYDGPLHEQ